MFHGIIKDRVGKNLLVYLHPPAVCAGLLHTGYIFLHCIFNTHFPVPRLIIILSIFDVNELFLM